MTEKYEHSPDLEAQHMDGAPLNRTNTAITLSNEQYERLFFQPSAPRAGDAAKRFANPSLLGLLGFLIPFTPTVLTLCQFQGAIPPYTLIGLTADYYFFGCIAMVIAGLAEFVLGNTFPFAVFIIYGVHWGSLAYNQDPLHGISSAYEAEGGANGAVYQSSQVFHNLTMCMVSFIILIGTLRVNLLFVGLFTSLVFLFALIAAADASVPTAATEADLGHILLLLRVAGGFGFVGMCCGWYLAIIEVCETVQIPCPLPVFDLGTKIFPAPKQKKSA